MATPRRSRRLSPPKLDPDNIREIFLRVPPDDVTSLVRAAAVSKDWRGILSDASFASLYSAIHGPAPFLLGFFHNSCGDRHCVSRFVSVASSFCPPGCGDRRDWYVLDSRHGRVLFCTHRAREEFVVCDPVTNVRWKIPPNPTEHSALLADEEGDEEFSFTWNAAVLCSINGCDHLDCSGGPFLVVFVGSEEVEGITFATVYSSMAGKWSPPIFINQANAMSVMAVGHGVLLKDKLYFLCETTSKIVEYNVGKQKLRVIRTPFNEEHHVLMTTDGNGKLLFTSVWESKLHLWSMKAGAVARAHYRVIELEPLLHLPDVSKMSVVGDVEGAGVIFLGTLAGLFQIDLNLGKSKKVHKNTFFNNIVPLVFDGVHRQLGAH